MALAVDRPVLDRGDRAALMGADLAERLELPGRGLGDHVVRVVQDHSAADRDLGGGHARPAGHGRLAGRGSRSGEARTRPEPSWWPGPTWRSGPGPGWSGRRSRPRPCRRRGRRRRRRSGRPGRRRGERCAASSRSGRGGGRAVGHGASVQVTVRRSAGGQPDLAVEPATRASVCLDAADRVRFRLEAVRELSAARQLAWRAGTRGRLRPCSSSPPPCCRLRVLRRRRAAVWPLAATSSGWAAPTGTSRPSRIGRRNSPV